MGYIDERDMIALFHAREEVRLPYRVPVHQGHARFVASMASTSLVRRRRSRATFASSAAVTRSTAQVDALMSQRQCRNDRPLASELDCPRLRRLVAGWSPLQSQA